MMENRELSERLAVLEGLPNIAGDSGKEYLRSLLARLFDNMKKAFVYHIADGSILYANRAAENVLGLTREQFLGRDSMDEQWQALDKDGNTITGENHPAMISLRTGQPVSDYIMSVTSTALDGRKWLSISSNPIFCKEKGEPCGASVVFDDITEKKHMERDFDNLFAQMQEGFSLCDMIWDEDGKAKDYIFISVNRAFEDMVGIKAEDAIGKTVLELLPGTEFYWIETYGNVVKTGKPLVFDNYSREIGKHFRVSAFKAHDNQFACIFNDVTEEVMAREALLKEKERAEESEKRFKALHNASFGGIAIHDKGVILDCNKGLSEITGYSLKELLGMDGLLLIAPSHRDYVMEKIVSGYEKQYEAVGIRKNGEEYPLQLEARNVRYYGKDVRTVEFRDISERVEAERTIREQNALLKEITDNVFDLISLADLEGNFTFLGKSHEKLGYNIEYLIGRNCLEFVHPDDLSFVADKFSGFLNSDLESDRIEYRYRCKDGSYVWLDTVGKMLRDEDGKPKQILFSSRDVTEQIKAEEALKKSEAQVRNKLRSILEPDSDISNLELSDLLDVETLQYLMDSFYALTKIGIGILDMKGNVLVGTGWQRICTHFHRVHSETNKLCIQSDLELSDGVVPGEFKLYRCKNNMWDMATPIIVGGKKLGNLFLGQFLFEDDDIDEQTFAIQARKYGFDVDDYIASYKALPRWSHETVDNVMSFYIRLINMVADMAYSQIQLAKTTEALRQSEAQIRHITENISDVVWSVDLQMNHIYVTPSVERMTGFKLDEYFVLPIEKRHPPDSIRKFMGILKQELEREESEDVDRQRSLVLEAEHYTKSGDIIQTSMHISFMRDENGIPIGLQGTTRDVTREKQIERQLIKSEDRLSRILDVVPDMVSVHNRKMDILYSNWNGFGNVPMEKRLTGTKCYETYRGLSDVCPDCLAKNIFEDDRPFSVDAQRPDGRWMDIRVIPLERGEDDEELFVEWVRDITDRKQREEQIRLSEAKWKSYVNHAPYGIFIADNHGTYVEVNPSACRITGYTNQELLGSGVGDIIYEDDLPLARQHFQAVSEKGNAYVELRFKRKDGEIRWWSVAATKITKERFIGFTSDITDRKKAEDALEFELESQKKLIQLTQNVLSMQDDGIDFQKITDTIREISGARYAAFNLFDDDGKSFRTVAMSGVAEHIQKASKMLGVDITRQSWDYDPIKMAKIRGREIARFENLSDLVDGVLSEKLIDKLARMFKVRQTVVASLYIDDRILGDFTLFIPWDIEFKNDNIVRIYLKMLGLLLQRTKVEQALKSREGLLQEIFDILPVGLWVADRDGNLIQNNPAGRRIWGVDEKTDLSDLGIFKARWLPSREEIKIDEWALIRSLNDGETILDELIEIDGMDGVKRTVLNSTAPIFNDNGDIDGAIVVNQDISELQRLQDQLHQAQKMEFVGRLAGGVAHDFNNMLGVILGHTELAMLKTESDNELYEDLTEIRKAANRSAALTKQLLAFARKQTVTPVVIDINDTISGMYKMLLRLIGENINLTWTPGDVDHVKIDPSQVDQILANLCVNSRDAIERYGNITIETSSATTCDRENHEDCTPSDYVVITVRDDGKGMEESDMDKIFEPFFTTKEFGKGTGLGLATVYGIVKQNKGFIEVKSKKGEGTTFFIYLPAYRDETSADRKSRAPENLEGGVGNILICEDEEAVVQMIDQILSKQGYNVMSVGTPEEALEIAGQYSFDILLTDVILPGIDGRRLSSEISTICPGIRIIFMSGYPSDIIGQHGIMEGRINFLQKPFTICELSDKIKSVLES